MNIPLPKTGVLRSWVVWRRDTRGNRVLVQVQIIRHPGTHMVTRVERYTPS